MSIPKTPDFQRTTNEYGEFESVCAACFDLIAIRIDEAQLAKDEANHRCSEMILSETLEYFRSHLVV